MTGVAVRAWAGRRRVGAAAVRAAGILTVLVVVVEGVRIARAAAAADHAYLVPVLHRAWADWIAGPLSSVAVAAPLHVFFAEAAAMAVAYAAAVVFAPRVGLWWIGAAVLVLHVVFALAPPMLSTDVFNYVDVARLGARYHLDPYTSTPWAERHDPVYVFLHWRHAVTDYGPLFTLAVRPLGRLTVADTVWAFKAVAAAAGLGCTALVGWLARQRGGSAARAVAVFGLNPIVLVWTVGGAHNDLLMLLGLLAGVALVLAGRPAIGGATVVTAAAIKLSAGLAIPFLVARRSPGRLRLLAGMVAAAAAVAGAATLAFPDHALGMFSSLQRQEALVDIASVPLGAAYALGLPAVTVPEVRVLHVLLAVWLAGCLVAVLRRADVLTVIGWALLGVVALSTWLLPWYVVWPLAFAAASGSPRLLIATCAVGLSYVVGHAPLA